MIKQAVECATMLHTKMARTATLIQSLQNGDGDAEKVSPTCTMNDIGGGIIMTAGFNVVEGSRQWHNDQCNMQPRISFTAGCQCVRSPPIEKPSGCSEVRIPAIAIRALPSR